MPLSHAPDQTPSQTDLARLRRIVAKRCPSHMNQQDTEDLTSEFLVSAVVTASAPDKDAPIVALAGGYAKSSQDRYKRHNDAARARLSSMIDPSDTADRRHVALHICGSHDEYIAADVRAVVRTLSPLEAHLLWMCDAEGCPLREAATELGMTVPTTHRRLQAARMEFRRAWGAA